MNSNSEPTEPNTLLTKSGVLSTSGLEGIQAADLPDVASLVEGPDAKLTQEEAHKFLKTTQNGLKSESSASTLEFSRADRSGAYQERESWEGIVLKSEGDTVWVRLVDPDRKRTDEEAELSLSDIPKFDRDLVRPGAPFYWSIGAWTSIMGSETGLPVFSDT